MGALTLVVALAAVTAAATAVLAWRRRIGTPAAVPLTAALAAASVWCTAGVLLATGQRPGALDALVHLQYLGITGTVAATRLFAGAVGGRRPTARAVLLLCVVPVLVQLALLVDPWTHWFYADVSYEGEPLRRETVLGPLFWAHALYCYALVTSGSLAVARQRRHATGLLRRQLGTVLVATVLPTALNVVTLTVPLHLFPLDPTPAAFAVSGLLFAYAVLRQELLELLPVARGLVVDTLGDGVVVVDGQGRLVDLNPAARALLERLGRGPAVVGRSFGDVAGPELAAAVGAGGLGGEGRGEGVVQLDGLSVDVRVRPIHDPRGSVRGRVAVLRDVTAELVQQRALEEANAQLRRHVDTIERLRADLAEEASRDPLTGLRNRRRFIDDLTALLAAGGGRAPVALVLLDVDHFKAVNDTHGHAVGDEVLVAVAGALREHARAEDVVRYGGEEFVVLLPGLGGAEAAARAEELRRACARLRVDDSDVRVTISAGVAACPEHGGTPDELLLAADRALYVAKTGGRDRVALAT
ncbi:diguanylate cyclase [Kineococcus gypseus]|uniref:diguanylate cyclase n=1 Tax=Kineococcus gypseus TaxID=1637102 RepID=UPI003D7EB9FD